MSLAPLPPETTDEELMAAIAGGDARAFARLFRRRQGDVYRFALHMTASPAAAEDITQDVFLAVMRDAGRFEPRKGSAAAWLCGIARNMTRRRFEREREVPLNEGEGATESELPPVVEDPLGDLARAERVETLKRAVLSLPLRYREVIVLCDLQEISYAETAAALGCAVGTVRSRLHRGRALLAAKVAAAEGPCASDRPDGPARRRCIA
jgi:RNA polymerase sigma-70 factor (ECF subfamily)